MRPTARTESSWDGLREVIAARLGLHFPPQRQNDLERGVIAAARDLGLQDADALLRHLTTGERSALILQTLAAHLTIGETYFFRDTPFFTALAEHVLPAIIARRRPERRLRLWSAACCTGEEPYSLAILLEQTLPDLDAWQTTLLATDINPKFLQKAAAGVYREWSFRATPSAIRQQYFQALADRGYAIAPRIKERVKFASLNLVEDAFPSVATDTQAMDLICCRNVLMYFTPAQMRRVIDHLYLSLAEGGWLVVSPSEASQELFARFAAVTTDGAILYRKCSTPAGSRAPLRIDVAPVLADAVEPLPSRAEVVVPALPEVVHDVVALAAAARVAADSGELPAASLACERWIAAAPLDAVARYLQAVVAQEQGDLTTAQRSFGQALYLDPEFVMAHLALGQLARANRDRTAARRHLTNALALLERCPDTFEPPESDGLTVARLRTMVASLLALEAAS